MNFNNLKKYANNIQKEIDQTIGSVSNNTEALGKFLKKKLDEIILAHSSAIDGAQDWVKQFIYGEFNDADDEKDVSVIATEMITGFLPGTTLVYSARDAVAVAMRMIKHPQKQDDLREWMLLVVYLLPFGIVATTTATGAAGGAGVGAGVGAAGAGVGAAPGAAVGGAVGGAGGAIVGSALANLVKCTALFLVKKEPSLAKIVNKLDQIVYGNVLNTLKKIKYSDYGQEITSKIVKLGNKLLSLTRQVKTLLEYAAKVNFMGAGWAKDIYKRMEMFEKALVSLIQKSASKVKQVLQEFDKQMQDLLKQTFKMEHAYATVGTKVKPVPPPSQTVRPSFPQTATANAAHTAGASTHMSGGSGKPPENVHQPKAKEQITKLSKQAKTACIKPVATKKALEDAQMLIDLDYPPGSKGKSPQQYIFEETERQLALQNEGLKNISVEEYLKNRQAYESKKDETGSGRGTSSTQNAARAKYENKLYEDYFRKYRKEGKKIKEAQELAKQAQTKIMSVSAALHNPDQKIGGGNNIEMGRDGIGMKRVNGSIGGQWNGTYIDEDTKTKTTRVNEIDKVAKGVPDSEKGKTGISTNLKTCK